MIRKFRLINANGDSFDLNNKLSFFHAVDGLGFTDDTQFEQIGTNFYPLEDVFAQGALKGSILFGGADAYVTYRSFSRFVRATPLTLVYQTDETFRIQVRLTELGKGEKVEGGQGLVSSVCFMALGLFYKSVNQYSGTLEIGGKIYDYEYPYTYADVSVNTVEIQSDSYEDSPCKITIYGPCTNPVWKHYINNTLVETGRYEGSLMADHKLVIDTTQIPFSITERGAMDELVADRYQFCDFSTERFFHLGYGSNRISVTHDGLNSVKVLVEGRISYETV